MNALIKITATAGTLFAVSILSGILTGYWTIRSYVEENIAPVPGVFEGDAIFSDVRGAALFRMKISKFGKTEDALPTGQQLELFDEHSKRIARLMKFDDTGAV